MKQGYFFTPSFGSIGGSIWKYQELKNFIVNKAARNEVPIPCLEGLGVGIDR